MNFNKKSVISLLLALLFINTFVFGLTSFGNAQPESFAAGLVEAGSEGDIIPLEATPSPGALFTTKTANPTPVACRTYEITLGAYGNPVTGVGNVDVVIVIDKSLSMKDDMTSVENIAKHLVQLINSYATQVNKVGLVLFDEFGQPKVTGGNHFSGDPNAWNSQLNGNKGSGPSNIAAGITAAKELLLSTEARHNDPNVNQAIVIFSDGVATTTLTGNSADGYVEPDFTTAKNNAIAAATEAANQDIIVYSVDTSPTSPNAVKGREAMTAIGKDGFIEITTFSQDPKTDGDTIYAALSSHLYAAATDANVTDIIDPRFEFVSFISYSPGTLAPSVATSGGTQVITWTMGTINQEPKNLVYRVRAKKEYPAGSIVSGTIPTNTSARLDFTPAAGSTVTSPIYFPIPQVYVAAPLAVTLTDASTAIGTPITLGTGTDPNGENYMAVTGGWYPLKSTQWYYASDMTPTDPTVTITTDTQFKVIVTDAYDCTASATMWVRPRGTLTITKNITGTANPNQTFVFEIKQYSSVDKAHLIKTFYETIRVSASSNNRIVISLPKGYYEAKEKSDWSWQYNPVGSAIAGDTLGMNADGTDNVHKTEAYVTFTDQYQNVNWFNSVDWVTNIF